MSSEAQPLQTAEEKNYQNFCLANIKVIARTLGLITIAVMWVATVIIIKDYKDSYVGYYLIAASSVVTFFEMTWIMDKLICCIRQGCCCHIWSAILWVDNWKKFILYVALSIPLFLENLRLWLGIVSGLLLIFLSTLYLIKTFRSSVSVTYQKKETTQRVVTGASFNVRTVLHEISTQTDEDHQVGTYSSSPSHYRGSTEPSEDGGAVNPPGPDPGSVH